MGILTKRKTKINTIPKLIANGAELTKSGEIAEEFNEYFCNIADDILKGIPNTKMKYNDFMPTPTNHSIYIYPTDMEEIADLIMAMNPRKATGDDGINVKIIQDSCHALVVPLMHIFNKSLEQGMVPKKMKMAKVVPIYKDGVKHFTKNYRPISLLSNFDKLLEKIMYKRLINFFNKYELLYKYQFGFRTSHSTSLALIDVIDNVYEELDAGNHVVGVFLDLKKAFDTVQHNILIEKLENYGIRGVASKWITSYLKDRNQYVMVDNVKSSIKSIGCGVPQGSILGPLLFLIYVNDMWRAVPGSSIKLFADDTNVFMAGSNLSLLCDNVNNELQKLSEWVYANKLSINYDKTCFSIFRPCVKAQTLESENIRIMIRNVQIKCVSTCKYLGIIIDDQLSWKGHIEYVYKKIVKFTSLFYRLRELLPAFILRNLYFALVYPHLCYGIEIYANTCASYLNQLMITNNRILRIILRKKLDTPVRCLYNEFCTLPVPFLFRFNINMLVYKVLNQTDELPVVYRNYFRENTTVHNHDTRSSTELHRNAVNGRHGFRAIKLIGPRLWNIIPANIKQISSLSLFKRTLKKHYQHDLMSNGID